MRSSTQCRQRHALPPFSAKRDWHAPDTAKWPALLTARRAPSKLPVPAPVPAPGRNADGDAGSGRPGRTGGAGRIWRPASWIRERRRQALGRNRRDGRGGRRSSVSGVAGWGISCSTLVDWIVMGCFAARLCLWMELDRMSGIRSKNQQSNGHDDGSLGKEFICFAAI